MEELHIVDNEVKKNNLNNSLIKSNSFAQKIK